MNDNVIEAASDGNTQVVLALSRDGQHAVPRLLLPDTFGSTWLLELTGADLARIFAQIETLLIANEDDVRGWIEDLRSQDHNALQQGIIMQFKSTQPAPIGPDEQLVSLAELAVEFTNGDIDRLARQVPAEAVVFDDIGRRCVSRSTARRLFTERAEREAKEARRRAEWAKRYRELDARMKAEVRGGIPATPGSTALADLMAADQR